MNDEEMLDEMVRRLGGELKQVLRQVRRRQIDAGALEGILRDALWHMASQALGVLLESLDRQLRADQRVQDYRTRTIVSLFGPLDVTRCRCRDGDRWRYPLDDAMRLDGHRGWTVGVQEAVSLLGCECSFAVVADLLGRLFGLSISVPTVEQLAEDAGQRAARLDPGDPPDPPVPVDTLILAVDGCLAPQRDGWHEVKLGTIYAKGSRCRGPSGRGKLAAKEYVGTLDDATAFGQLLWERATAWGVDEAHRVVVMGDGAVWIWNLAALHFPGATEIVDFYHAVEHLWALGEALWGDRQTSVATRSWVRRYRHRLLSGRVDLVLAAAARGVSQQAGRLSQDRQKVIRLNVGYFRRNASRMRYGRFRQMGLPIGTGAVEGACKHVVQSRFKRAGMRWSPDGLERMLALRLTRLNNRWEQLWPHLQAA
jgi:hypothetical protein